MVNRIEYKNALKTLDRSIRLCILYLEQKIQEQNKVINVPPPSVDLTPIEVRMESLEQKIKNFDNEKNNLQKIRKDIETMLTEKSRKHDKLIKEMEEVIETNKMVKTHQHHIEMQIPDTMHKRITEAAKRKGLTVDEYIHKTLVKKGLKDE